MEGSEGERSSTAEAARAASGFAATPGEQPSSQARAGAHAGSPGRAPDFFIVGHSKCGTTAIFDMLQQHPQLHMPVKEPRYFVPELRSRYWRPAANERVRPHTLEGYLAIFADARPDQLIGEATPEYLRSFTAPRRIADVQPDARIIAVLREPVSFLRSLHLQAVHNYNETQKDFQKAIELEPARRRGKRIPPLSQAPQALLYSDHVRYAQQLRAYAETFPAENILVLVYDDFRADNVATVQRILRFLGVDDANPVAPIRTGTLPGVRFQLLEQLSRAWTIARHNPSAGPWVRRVEGVIPQRLRGALWGRLWRRLVFKDNVAPDERFILELRRRFKGEVVALSEYLGRDLVSEWGYNRVG